MMSIFGRFKLFTARNRNATILAIFGGLAMIVVNIAFGTSRAQSQPVAGQAVNVAKNINGVSVELKSVTKLPGQLDVTVCYPIAGPSIDYLPRKVFVNLDGQKFGNYRLALAEWTFDSGIHLGSQEAANIPTADWLSKGKVAGRCDLIMFEIPADLSYKSATLEIGQIALSGFPESITCDQIRDNLAKKIPTYQLTCDKDTKAWSVKDSTDKSSQDGAQQFAEDTLLDAKYGPWQFDIPVSN